MNDSPQLLIAWSSPWREFVAAVGPALRPSPPRMRLEARSGLFPLRGMLVALLLEVAALATVIAHPSNELEPVVLRNAQSTHEVIYFSADELPKTEDVAGAPAGVPGASGGASIRHRSQTIKVAREENLRDRVTDAPNLDLPKSESQLSNLLAYKALAGPAPAEALFRNRHVPSMTTVVVPPPAEIHSTDFRQVKPLPSLAVAAPPVALPQHGPPTHALLPATVVVPPPAAAPLEITNHAARLTLPLEKIVAPAPEIDGTVQLRRQTNQIAARVVPPPVELAALRSKAQSVSLNGVQVIASPAVEIGSVEHRALPGLGKGSVVAPPADLAQTRTQRTLQRENIPVTMASNAIAKPPSPIEEAKGTLVSSNAGVIVSAKPGEKPAMPATPEKATMAMSPKGTAAAGSGGEGTGKNAGRENGPGNSASGTASGASTAGTGKGASLSARNGSGPYPGPGGAGTATATTPRVPGVSVSGGKNVVTLPSFGAAPDPSVAGRSITARNMNNGITVIASPRSGGALNLYGALKGDRVYTIYIHTKIGTAIMQFADAASLAHPSSNELTAPHAMSVEVPSELLPDPQRSKLLIGCELDRNGVLQNPHVLQSDGSDFAQKILAALASWKFSPAFRGNEAVEVNAILGFGVDTR